MKQALKSIAIGLVIITFSSCGDGFRNCIKGDGHYISETRIISEPFIGVELDGSFNVYINSDTVQSVIVDADSNIIPYIITRVRSNRLLIDSDKKCFRTKKSIDIYVTIPEVEEIIHNGSGIIECNEMETQEAVVELNGSGEIFVDLIYSDDARIMHDGSGIININYLDTYNEAFVSLDGSGKVDIERVKTYTLTIEHDGSGEVNMYKIDANYISAILDGSGSIELEGDAGQSDLKLTGSGNIDAFRLYQDVCDAYISGSGSIYVFVIDDLYAEVPGSGVIYFKGSPRIFYSGSTSHNKVIPVN